GRLICELHCVPERCRPSDVLCRPDALGASLVVRITRYEYRPIYRYPCSTGPAAVGPGRTHRAGRLLTWVARRVVTHHIVPIRASGSNYPLHESRSDGNGCPVGFVVQRL